MMTCHSVERGIDMNRLISGQCLLVLCCVFYLVWWYRGFRPGITVNRVGGVNGVLLLVTAVLGLAGVSFSLLSIIDTEISLRFSPTFILFGGIMIYVLLLLVTKYAFHRIVTSELLLIVVWTMLETAVVIWLNSAGYLTGYRLAVMVIVLMAAFVISIILYVAYYRMEEMKAFYAAMVPLVTEAAAMIVLVGFLLTTEKPV